MRSRAWPVATLLFVAAGVVASLVPDAQMLLAYDRRQAAAGEWWRLFTGQSAHWTVRMAVVDLGAVLVLGAWLERRAPALARFTIVSSLLLTGLAVHFVLPAIVTYRGASGVASGLFVAALVYLGSEHSGRRPEAIALAGAFLVKTLWEASRGALAAGPLPAGVDVVPLVHLGGAAAGLLAAVSYRASAALGGSSPAEASVLTAPPRASKSAPRIPASRTTRPTPSPNRT